MASVWETATPMYFGYGTPSPRGADPPESLGPEIPYRDDRHIITIGPNGSGKRRRVLLTNLAKLKDWSIVVVDPKGDLAQMTREHRDPTGERTIILNPFKTSGLHSDGYNPITALPKDSNLPDNCMALAEAIVRVEGREPHWSASAQDLVAGLIMYERLRHADGNFSNVRTFIGMSAAKFKANIAEALNVAKVWEFPELEAKLARFADITPESRELLSIISTASTQTRWLDSRPIQEDLKVDSEFDFARLKQEPWTIYLILPPNRLGTHSTWMRLMLASILRPLMMDTAKAKTPVLLMLDEYPALAAGGFPIIEQNMAMFRGFGIKLWTVWQDFGQAQKLYGNSWQSFVANSGVLQSFAPQDVLTAEFLSKLMPLVPMRAHTATMNFQPNPQGGRDAQASPSHGTSAVDQGIPMMLPQHLRNMDPGYAVLFSHLLDGPIHTYFPWHKDGLDEIYAKDTS